MRERHFRPRHVFRARRAGGNVTSQLAVGIFIMFFGLLLTLDRLRLLDGSVVLRYWPLALVALGVTILARQQDAHGRFWGTAWIAVGGWLLLNTLGLVQVGFWRLFWPLTLVFIGVSLIRQAMGRPSMPFARAAGEGPSSGVVSQFAMWSSSRSSVDGGVLRRASMTALMGGCVLDARQATVPPEGEAVIDVLAIMGGIEVFVPSGWTVVADVASVLGGVEDKRLPAVPIPPGSGQVAPRLVVRGVLVMGGLVIKN